MDAHPRGVLADYLTEEKLAGELGRSTRTLARWRQQRIGPPFVTNGREVRYNTEAARAWLAAGGTSGAAAAKRGRSRQAGSAREARL